MSSSSPTPPVSRRRDQIIQDAAAAWLDAVPDRRIGLGAPLLAQVVGQVLTFVLARPDGGAPFCAHGIAVLEHVGVSPRAALGVREVTKRGEVPLDLTPALGALAETLAPIAAAILLARTPTIELGVAMARVEGTFQETGTLSGALTRDHLKDRVVSSLTREALEVHEEAGPGLPHAAYLDRLLARAPRAGRSTYERALASLETLPPLTPETQAHLEAVVEPALPRLRARARRLTRTADQAEDLLGHTLLKVALRLQKEPDFRLSPAYVMGALSRNAKTPPPASDTRSSLTPTGSVPEGGAPHEEPESLHLALARAVCHAMATLTDGAAANSESELAGEALGEAYLAESGARLNSAARVLVDGGDPMLEQLLQGAIRSRGLEAGVGDRVLRLAQHELRAAVLAELTADD